MSTVIGRPYRVVDEPPALVLWGWLTQLLRPGCSRPQGAVRRACDALGRLPQTTGAESAGKRGAHDRHDLSNDQWALSGPAASGVVW